MGIVEVLNRIRLRVMKDMFDLELIEPPPPRAEWPKWSTTKAKISDVRLRVLSLNAWGLPVAPKVSERAEEIAKAIQSGYEIVVLQEVWHRRERNLLIARAEQAGFHYYHYFNPAVGFPVPLGADSFGTGLLVLSKFPIVSAMYYSFSLTGRPYALHEADFLANKGAGLLRIQTPAGQIDMYVTHLLANYNHLGMPGPGDRYMAQRVAQSYELARIINATAKNPLTLVCGDFNSPSDCLVLRIPREVLGLRDAFTDMNAHDGLTFATEDNKYSRGEHPMRMDYILYKINQTHASTVPGEPMWHLVYCDVFKSFFTDTEGEHLPLSDHFGVAVEFIFGICSLPLKPCQQALGEASKEQASPVNKALPAHLRTCRTTTCIHCDHNNIQEKKWTPDGFPLAVKCLQEMQCVILEGRSEAMDRRTGHLRRAATSILGVILLIALHMSTLVRLSHGTSLVISLLTIHALMEYIIAFYFVTFECSTFTELGNQIRLHLHAEQANEAVL